MGAVAVQVCSVCGAAGEEFAAGPNGRPNARCRGCSSLERHRLLSLLVELAAPRVLERGLLLDVAPSATTTPRLRELGGERYTGLDFDPAADGRRVDVRASMTALPFAERSADLVICYHVLEHVPDDAAAMRELARVLRPGGIALVQVPCRPGPTEEDPSAPVEERIRRFGQADHVRYYGDDDVDARLEKAGLAVRRVRTAEIVPPGSVELFRLAPEEPVWLCTAAGAQAPLTPERIRADWAAALEVTLRRVAARDAQRKDPELTTRDVLRFGYGRLPGPVRASLRRVRR